MADPYRNHHFMFDHARHNLNNSVPLERPQRAEIVRRGRVMATVYPRHGEALEDMQSRAQRMAAAYAGKVVIHAP